MSENRWRTPDAGACPSFVAAMGIVGKPWNGLIVQALGSGCESFTQIARYATGLSDAMLSRRLTELCERGLVVREVIDTRPPGVRYGLTAAGLDLVPVLDALTDWAESHMVVTADAETG